MKYLRKFNESVSLIVQTAKEYIEDCFTSLTDDKFQEIETFPFENIKLIGTSSPYSHEMLVLTYKKTNSFSREDANTMINNIYNIAKRINKKYDLQSIDIIVSNKGRFDERISRTYRSELEIPMKNGIMLDREDSIFKNKINRFLSGQAFTKEEYFIQNEIKISISLSLKIKREL